MVLKMRRDSDTRVLLTYGPVEQPIRGNTDGESFCTNSQLVKANDSGRRDGNPLANSLSCRQQRLLLTGKDSPQITQAAGPQVEAKPAIGGRQMHREVSEKVQRGVEAEG